MTRPARLALAKYLPGRARPRRLAAGKYSQLPDRVVQPPRAGLLSVAGQPDAGGRMPVSPAARSLYTVSLRLRSDAARPQGFRYHAQPAPDRKAPRPGRAGLPLLLRCVLPE